MKKVRIGFLIGCVALVAHAYSQAPVFQEEFEGGIGTWWVGFEASVSASGTSSIDESAVLSGPNSLMIEIVEGGTADWQVGALNNDVPMEQGKTYDLYFMALADAEINIGVAFKKTVDPWTQYVRFPVTIGGEEVHFGPFKWTCNRTDGTYAACWLLGRYDNVYVWLDSVVVVEHVDTAVEGCCCPDDASALPHACALEQNYPNPFNPSTTIPYALSEPGDVSLGVYNLSGQLVRTLVQDAQNPGAYFATWDGTDGRGQSVSSGVYICRLDVRGNATSYSQSRKIFFMK